MKKILTSLAAAAALIGGTVLTGAPAAQAAGVQQMCSGWDESTIVSDTPTWGRIGQRVCVQWKDDGSLVREKLEARFDWPQSGCTVSVPLGASCPLDRVWKNKRVSLDGFWMDLDFEGPGQPADTASCDKGPDVYQPFTQLGGAVTTGCVGPWVSAQEGDYWVEGNITFLRGGTETALPTAAWFGVTF